MGVEMGEFFEWCIGIGLFFVGLSVAWHIFWLLVAMLIVIVGWIGSLFDGE